MGGNAFSQEIFNTREEVVSDDHMRAQRLISRDVQDSFGASSRSIDSAAAVPTSSASLLTALGAPVSAVDVAPTLTAPSGFTLQLGAGSGFLYDTGNTSDFSSYQVLRWPTQTVTFSGSNPSNPRIDVVYATLATVATDTAVRNVLVDPNARTVAAQSVNKTNNPLSTIGIQTGTPAATPTIPAIPVHSLPLFYVWVPGASGSAASFAYCRASWRRAPYPHSAGHGILNGMTLKWDLSIDTSSVTSVKVPRGFHRIVIDGEVLEFVAEIDSNHGGVTQDISSANAQNPFNSAAPSTNSKPYYIYAVGGRHLPQANFNSNFANDLSPVILVESLTPPDLNTGKPTSALTLTGPVTVQDGACYIGLGFVAPNSTNRQAAIQDEQGFTFFGANSTTNQSTLTLSGSGSQQFSSTGLPLLPFDTTAVCTLSLDNVSAAVSTVRVVPDNDAGSNPAPSFNHGISGSLALIKVPVASAETVYEQAVLPWRASGPLWATGGNNTDVIQLYALGLKHRAKMFGTSA